MKQSSTTFHGSFSDHEYLGNPSNPKDRQFASEGGPGYQGGGNLIDKEPTDQPDLYMVPDFQGMSGQGNNQSTNRPKGST